MCRSPSNRSRSYFGACLAALTVALASRFPAAVGEPSVREQFDIAPQCEVILLPISVYGRTFAFTVNTGATRTVFYTAAKSLLGPAHGSQSVFTATGTLQCEKYEPPPMWLGKLPFAPRQGAYLDEKTVCPYQTYGQLGMDLLGQHRINIDFDNGILRLLDRAAEPTGKPIPISRMANLPTLKADVAGKEVDFIIATGARGNGSGSLSEDLFDRLARDGGLAVLGESSVTQGAVTTRTSFGRLRTLSVGGETHHGALFYRTRLNILGLSYLSRYVVTFDFPHNTLYLKAGKEFSRPDSLDMSGLALRRVDDETVITSVAARSPAQTAGIAAGDVLVAMDAMTVRQATLYDIRRRFHAQGKRIRLTIRRNAETIEHDLVTETEAHLVEKAAARRARSDGGAVRRAVVDDAVEAPRAGYGTARTETTR